MTNICFLFKISRVGYNDNVKQYNHCITINQLNTKPNPNTVIYLEKIQRQAEGDKYIHKHNKIYIKTIKMSSKNAF